MVRDLFQKYNISDHVISRGVGSTSKILLDILKVTEQLPFPP